MRKIDAAAEQPNFFDDLRRAVLVKHGLLTGEPTLTMPVSGEKLVPAP